MLLISCFFLSEERIEIYSMTFTDFNLIYFLHKVNYNKFGGVFLTTLFKYRGLQSFS